MASINKPAVNRGAVWGTYKKGGRVRNKRRRKFHSGGFPPNHSHPHSVGGSFNPSGTGMTGNENAMPGGYGFSRGNRRTRRGAGIQAGSRKYAAGGYTVNQSRRGMMAGTRTGGLGGGSVGDGTTDCDPGHPNYLKCMRDHQQNRILHGVWKKGGKVGNRRRFQQGGHTHAHAHSLNASHELQHTHNTSDGTPNWANAQSSSWGSQFMITDHQAQPHTGQDGVFQPHYWPAENWVDPQTGETEVDPFWGHTYDGLPGGGHGNHHAHGGTNFGMRKSPATRKQGGPVNKSGGHKGARRRGAGRKQTSGRRTRR